MCINICKIIHCINFVFIFHIIFMFSFLLERNDKKKISFRIRICNCVYVLLFSLSFFLMSFSNRFCFVFGCDFNLIVLFLFRIYQKIEINFDKPIWPSRWWVWIHMIHFTFVCKYISTSFFFFVCVNKSSISFFHFVFCQFCFDDFVFDSLPLAFVFSFRLFSFSFRVRLRVKIFFFHLKSLFILEKSNLRKKYNFFVAKRMEPIQFGWVWLYFWNQRNKMPNESLFCMKSVTENKKNL